MATPTLEERVAALEAKAWSLEEEIGRLKTEEKAHPSQDQRPWWEQIRGTFKDDPAYIEAMRIGREYRESLRPKDDQDTDI